MNRIIGAIVALAVVLFVATKGVRWWHELSNRELMQRSVQAYRAKLPRVVQDGIVETRMELVDRVVKTRYTVEPMFQTDPETTAVFAKAMKNSICSDAAAVEVFEMGYSFDRTYEVRTPHGPDEFHVVAMAADCPGVNVKKS